MSNVGDRPSFTPVGGISITVMVPAQVRTCQYLSQHSGDAHFWYLQQSTAGGKTYSLGEVECLQALAFGLPWFTGHSGQTALALKGAMLDFVVEDRADLTAIAGVAIAVMKSAGPHQQGTTAFLDCGVGMSGRGVGTCCVIQVDIALQLDSTLGCAKQPKKTHPGLQATLPRGHLKP
jgi:hypothetical protein